MKETEELIQILNQKINEDSVLLFDMDGTLVDTDFANFLSYKNAIQTVVALDMEIQYKPNERFNRTSLKNLVQNLTDSEYDKIIELKELNYVNLLFHTKLNHSVVNILTRYYKTNKTVLVTNCREDRARETLDYHNLIDKFSYLFFRQTTDKENRINKYTNAINLMSLSAHRVIVFENEELEIENAILAGISYNNILSL